MIFVTFLSAFWGGPVTVVYDFWIGQWNDCIEFLCQIFGPVTEKKKKSKTVYTFANFANKDKSLSKLQYGSKNHAFWATMRPLEEEHGFVRC